MTDWTQLARQKQSQLDSAASQEANRLSDKQTLKAHSLPRWDELKNNMRANIEQFNSEMTMPLLRFDQSGRDAVYIRRMTGDVVSAIQFNPETYQLSTQPSSPGYELIVVSANGVAWKQNQDVYTTVDLGAKLVTDAVNRA
jgi:hypothetical protein